jgi:hypothetical protein
LHKPKPKPFFYEALMSDSKPVFDIDQHISIKLQSPEGLKELTLRFPTDAEWIERQRKRKIIIKQLGRGLSETIIPDSSEYDSELVMKLRAGEEPGIDGFEATRILEELSLAEVEEIEQDGNAFLVNLKVPGTVTIHAVKMPSAKDLFQYRRAFTRVLDLPYNKQQLTLNLNAAEELYKKLSESAEGYAGPVPINHQAAVIQAVVNKVESGFGVAGQENF